MTCKEVLENRDTLIGKHGLFMWTGMLVNGTITKIEETYCSVVVYFDMDKPQVWGDYLYYKDSVWARKEDNFGPLSKSYIHETI